ncbi:hypothetical protein PMI13_00942 [Chryseobacterium populi]|uniref:Calcineurin-like phosphoesterase domain-containing protein n=1 Tax=Chryseobacterium populi TaxID=1144316 RepID=J3CLT5_9FLAO|nr:hypothetical protein PMI13_00942 [Chryseobacterium populi]
MIQIVVFSDIHGNLPTLEMALNDIEEEEFVMLLLF